MQGSYIEKISVHNTFSRMLSIQGADYLKIDGNLGFSILGHGIALTSGG